MSRQRAKPGRKKGKKGVKKNLKIIMSCHEVRTRAHLQNGLQALEGHSLASVDGVSDETAEGGISAVRLVLQKPEIAVQVVDRVLDGSTTQAPPSFRLHGHLKAVISTTLHLSARHKTYSILSLSHTAPSFRAHCSLHTLPPYLLSRRWKNGRKHTGRHSLCHRNPNHVLTPPFHPPIFSISATRSHTHSDTASRH